MLQLKLELTRLNRTPLKIQDELGSPLSFEKILQFKNKISMIDVIDEK